MNIRDYLTIGGYEGLRSDECACDLTDLAPCDCLSLDECQPAYRVPCTKDKKACDYCDCRVRENEWCYTVRKPRAQKEAT